jgi:enediyne biosynthesis protein E4
MHSYRLALSMILAATAVAAQPQARILRHPANDVGVATLDSRAILQSATLPQFGVFAGFEFEDREPESGIDFVHHSTADSLRDWKPAHYDHGNGVSVADVDGDGDLDVYLLTQIGSNRLYRNLGGGRFEDMTDTAGVGLANRISVAGSFGDFDNDGDPDLFVTSVRGGNTLFVNDGHGAFSDATAGSGLEYSGHSSGSVWFDYDGDGWLDLFLTNVGVYTNDEKGPGGFYRGLMDAFEGHKHPERAERSRLYHNLGDGHFADVSEGAGCIDDSWSGDATFTDLNGDRRPDLYVLNMQGDDHYFENRGADGWMDRTAELFPKTSWGAMGVKFFDWDNDGRFDLMVTDMHSDMHSAEVRPLHDEKIKYDVPLDDGENNLAGNAFYHQLADGSFREISDTNGAENFWPWGLSVADLNADGYEDAFVASSMNFPFRYGVNSVLLNDRGTMLRDAEFILGVEPRRDGRTHTVLFDMDCDGADKGHKLCEQIGGKFSVEGALGTRSSVVFDVDGDGDLDILTAEFNDRPQLLISNLSEKRDIHWVRIALRGTTSNRDGLGALVRVVTERGTLTRYHDGKSGYLSQSSAPLYVGLGEATKIERIEVEWPSGTDQTLTEGLTLNTRIDITEPAG